LIVYFLIYYFLLPYIFIFVIILNPRGFLPQCSLNSQTSIQTMKKWQVKKLELFVKRVYNQAGLES